MYIPYLCVLLMGLSLGTIVIVRSLRFSGVQALVTNPMVLFTIYFSLIHFLVPAIKHLAGFYRYQATYSETTYLIIGLTTLAIYVFAIFLLDVIQRRFPIDVALGPSFMQMTPLMAYTLLVFGVGAVSAYQDYRTISQAVGVEDFLSDRHEASEARGMARVFAGFMVIGFSLYLSAAVSRTMRFQQLLPAIAMIAFTFYYYGQISSRNSILILVLFGVTSFLLSSRSFSSGSMQIAGVLLLTLLACVTYFGMYLLTINRYSISDTSQAQERLGNAVLYSIDGAFGNDEALLWLWEADSPIQKGATYAAAFSNVIPRRFWPEKPLGGGPVLINLINPGSYEIGGTGNNSLTTGMLTEALMNFGYIGMFLITAAWCLAVHWVMMLLAACRNFFARNTCLILMVMMCTGFLHMEFLGFTVKLGVFLLPVIMGFILLRHAVMVDEEEEDHFETDDDAAASEDSLEAGGEAERYVKAP